MSCRLVIPVSTKPNHLLLFGDIYHPWAFSRRLLLRIFVWSHNEDKPKASDFARIFTFSSKTMDVRLHRRATGVRPALAGIRVHGDFESAEEHSERMTDSLALLKDDYTLAMRRAGTFDDTAQRLIATSRVMTEDLASWHDLYGRKRLVLPA
jgi:hypothetical protein